MVRPMLTGLLAVSILAVVFSPTTLTRWISESARANEAESQSDKNESRPVVRVSVEKLLRMLPGELEDFAARSYYGPTDKGPITVIDGFSREMSAWILQGAQYRSRIFRRLLRDLKGVTDEDRRLRILDEARAQLKAEFDATQRSVESLKDRRDAARDDDTRERLSETIDEETDRMNRARVALEAVETWIKHPMEGTRK